MNVFKATVDSTNAMVLVSSLMKKSKEGSFEHSDFEGGAYQWASFNPRATIQITERRDGLWDISFEGAVAPTKEAKCLVDFALATEKTFNAMRLDSPEAIHETLMDALTSELETTEEIGRVREFLEACS